MNLLDLPGDILGVIIAELTPSALDSMMVSRVCTGLQKYVRTSIISRDICVEAAVRGYINIIEYLHAEGYPLDDNVSYAAVNENRIDVLEWLISTGCTCGDDTFACAAGYGNIEALELFKKADYKYSHHRITASAAYNGEVNTVKWLCSNEYCSIEKLEFLLHCITIFGNNRGVYGDGDAKYTEQQHAEMLEFLEELKAGNQA